MTGADTSPNEPSALKPNTVIGSVPSVPVPIEIPSTYRALDAPLRSRIIRCGSVSVGYVVTLNEKVVPPVVK